MKEKIKLLLFLLCNLFLGYITFLFMPTMYANATNTMKGPVNDLDGETFIPLGWLGLFFFPALVVTCNVLFFKNTSHKKSFVIFSIVTFMIGALLGMIHYNTGHMSPYKFLPF